MWCCHMAAIHHLVHINQLVLYGNGSAFGIRVHLSIAIGIAIACRHK